MDEHLDANRKMGDNDFKSEGIDINKGASTIGSLDCTEFSFEEYHSTTVFSHSYDGDDEVFLDTDETVIGGIRITREPRPRRISDVIDSLGEEISPREVGGGSHFTFPDFVETPSDSSNHLPISSSRFQSPPVTPGSDVGYYSTGLSTPPSLLNYKHIWSRHNSPTMETVPRKFSSPENPSGANNRTSSKWDVTDAKPTSSVEAVTERVLVEARMPVDMHSPVYNMNHERRGLAVVFNNETFKSELTRKGSNIDVDYIKQTFGLLGFEVVVHLDFCLEEILEVIRSLRKMDFSNCDCLLMVVLTHGIEKNFIHAKDYLYSVDMLWQSFTPEHCPTLAGKPKIFFIQACKGQSMDGGVKLMRRKTETDSSNDSYKIPNMADFLVVYSSVEGYYSWRNPENGTWFIQSLCSVLNEHYQNMDLLKMLTVVMRKVALEFESYNEFYFERHGQKQVPSIYSTLIRDLYLKPK